MSRPHQLAPSPSALSSSLRDLGYSLETAVADIIDNSISAEASDIHIYCDLNPVSPTLVIVDNGTGMTDRELLEAMRHGAVKPGKPRSPRDLGRFGLGLKTASFSQCRKLTVVSSQNGVRSAAEWDLDLIDRKDEWLLLILDDEEIAQLPFIEHLGPQGTIVIWRNLDRLLDHEDSSKRDEIVNEKLDLLEKHLSLVFHRFLAGEFRGRRKIAISINNHPVEPFDPFCRKSGSEMLPEEIVRIGDQAVHMQPYILPHHSRLSEKDYNYYQNRSDFISNQGAYIYRNGRLMAWGDWFRLIPKGESTKLARIQIDFPSALDALWTIDIKKSRAKPPHAVRERLRQLIPRISGRSTTIHRGRGQRLFDEIRAPMWERFAEQGRIRYGVNFRHPLAEAVGNLLNADGAKNFRLLLEAIGSALPVEMIYSDFSTNPRDIQQAVPDDTFRDRLQALRAALFQGGAADKSVFREVVRSTRLFDNRMDEVDKFIREELA